MHWGLHVCGHFQFLHLFPCSERRSFSNALSVLVNIWLFHSALSMYNINIIVSASLNLIFLYIRGGGQPWPLYADLLWTQRRIGARDQSGVGWTQSTRGIHCCRCFPSFSCENVPNPMGKYCELRRKNMRKNRGPWCTGTCYLNTCSHARTDSLLYIHPHIYACTIFLYMQACMVPYIYISKDTRTHTYTNTRAHTV